MTGQSAFSLRVRQLALPVKVIAVLAAVLLPLGLAAAYMALRGYRLDAALAHDLSLAQWAGVAAPLVMWLATLVLSSLLADRLLVRPLLTMRRSVERYTAGAHDVRLGGQDFVSQEVGALAAAFDRMADEISAHDAALSAALAEQKRLTREVHHRVKNNLQIVSSLLSLQARELPSADVAQAYATVQARVGALALVHRSMYDGGTPYGVDLHALALDLCAALEQGVGVAGQAPMTLRCLVEPIIVGQDTAVPLAFFITELVSLAARRVAPAKLSATVTAARHSGGGMLSVTAAPFVDDEGLGKGNSAKRIIEGMARQLRTPLEHDAAAGSYGIAFPLAAP